MTHIEGMIILGGGMVGQLAKLLFPKALVLDWRPIAPRDKHMNGAKQFGAQYLWEPLPGIPCRSFRVLTTIDGEHATVESAIRYKLKIGKAQDTGRTDADLMSQFPYESVGHQIISLPRAETRWNVYVERIDVERQMLYTRTGDAYAYQTLISTIPLPSLLEMLDALGPVRGQGMVEMAPFKAAPVCVKAGPIPPDAVVLPDGMVRVNYISDMKIAAYRTTDREGQRHYEWLQGAPGMGIPTKVINPGKIWPHNESEQWVRFLHDSCNIHCFGRFPTWRPDELLHQTYQHILSLRAAIGA